MRKASKALCTAIALILLLSYVAGCSQGSNVPAATTAAPGQTPTDTSAQTVSAAAEQSATAPEASKTPAWQEDTSPIELTFFQNFEGLAGLWFMDSEKSRCVEIRNKTGVTLKLMDRTGSQGDEKINAMAAANNLPDFICMDTSSAFYQLPKSGKVYPLMDLIHQYDPEMEQLVPKDMVSFWQMDDGQWYHYMSMFWSTLETTDVPLPAANTVVAARKDIMDQLGIKPGDFGTLDGMYNALKKVKDAQIQTKGGLMDPFTCNFPNSIYEQFGESAGFTEEGPDGKIMSIYRAPKMLELLLFFSKLWREGLFYKDTFTSTWEQFSSLIKVGKEFCVSGSKNLYPFNIPDLLQNYDNNKDVRYVPVEYPKTSDNEPIYLANPSTAGFTGTMISKNCKNPERAIKFMHYMITEEGQMLSLYGIPDVAWVWDDAHPGHIKMTDDFNNLAAQGTNKTWDIYGYDAWWFWNPIIHDKVAPYPATGQDLNLKEFTDFIAGYTYNGMALANTEPPADSEVAAIKAKIAAEWDKYLVKIIMSSSEDQAKALYNEFLAKLDQLGEQKYLDAKDALFQKHKKDMGISYVFPGYQK